MSFDDAVVRCLSKYAVFTGRARRSEFWWFMILYAGSLPVAAVALTVHPGLALLALSAVAALTPPALAVSVRRLHDVGASGWAMLFLVPVAGQMLLLLWLARPGVARVNRYGPQQAEERERVLLFAR